MPESLGVELGLIEKRWWIHCMLRVDDDKNELSELFQEVEEY